MLEGMNCSLDLMRQVPVMIFLLRALEWELKKRCARPQNSNQPLPIRQYIADSKLLYCIEDG